MVQLRQIAPFFLAHHLLFVVLNGDFKMTILVPAPRTVDETFHTMPTIDTVYNWIRPYYATLTADTTTHIATISFINPLKAYDFADYYGRLLNASYEVHGCYVRIPFWVQGKPNNPVYANA